MLSFAKLGKDIRSNRISFLFQIGYKGVDSLKKFVNHFVDYFLICIGQTDPT